MKNSLVVLLFSICVTVTSGQTPTPISEVQGDGYYSPLADQTVTIEGTVTAIRKVGFYVQTPDDKIDNNPKTSEGIYVYTVDPPESSLKIGNFVEVKGKVAEFKSNREVYPLFLTEIVEPQYRTISEDNAIPEPIPLTSEDLRPDGQIEQLERFEGMRVKIDQLMVVAPTGGFFENESDSIKSDGAFFGVLANTPRPFREPGLDALKVLIDKLPQDLPVFDMNPELIRIDSDGLGAAPIDVTSGALITNLVGVVDYSFRSYTLLLDPDLKPEVSNIRKFVPAIAAAEGEITVASFNLENFFDDEENSELGGREEQKVSTAHFQKRLKKASLAIRNVASSPDVLGIIEVENLTVLKKLASQVNNDAVASGESDPKYQAVLEESNDVRGIDVGFLVKTAKIKVLSSRLLGSELKHEHPDADPQEALFSRPPMLAEFEMPGTDTTDAFKFTVIVNHFKSLRDVETERVQNKKRAQAEFLAKFVSERGKENPEEKLILIGDFNAFEFPDGYNDVIGTLKGKPEKSVMEPAENVFETGLINLVDYISKGNRYSYIFGGSAQTLDHILINKPTRKNAKKFGYARLNADFPKVYANDETRPERISDHDVPVLYLSIDEKKVVAETPDVVKAIPDVQGETTPFSASLFYSFDDKNSDDAALDIDEWVKSKMLEASEDRIVNDLFEHKGGGANGAEWNPNGTLHVMIEAVSSGDTVKPEIRINGEAFADGKVRDFVSEKNGDTYYWIEIPVGLWQQKLRDIEDQDLIGLFGEETLDRINAGESELPAPLKTGKIIVFDVKLDNKIVKKYFHASFGE